MGDSMIRRLRFIVTSIVLGILLTGCASTIRSDVIAFHQWPADLPVRTFAFQRTPEQETSLEYRSYEDLVRNELSRLGYIPDAEKRGAALTVAISYDVRSAQVVVTEPYDPFYYGPSFYPGWGWRHGGSSYSYYDPFFGPPMQQTIYPIYTRRLHILITNTSDKKPLYEVEVASEGRKPALQLAMPYMIRSAFTDFPGQNGVMHQVKLKIAD
jgi:hypothetical protein